MKITMPSLHCSKHFKDPSFSLILNQPNNNNYFFLNAAVSLAISSTLVDSLRRIFLLYFLMMNLNLSLIDYNMFLMTMSLFLYLLHARPVCYFDIIQ